MMTQRSLSRIFAIGLVILLMSGTASASPLAAAIGTGFSYQGSLTEGGSPANGIYDFEFKLYNALTVGSQVGSTITQGDLTVTNGLFTTQLDFGNVFDGTALFLDIGVRPGASAGAYTALTPRQALTATPYALYAMKAPWSGLSGVPAGFADGTDNSASYDNLIVVAKSGGDYTTITAALNSISDATTTNRYLIYVAPGVYSEQVTMKEFVDIEGSGELTTKVTFTGSGINIGTVLGANNTELRLLTVENTGGNSYAIAISNSSVSPRLTHITTDASGGMSQSVGVFNVSISSPIMMNVSASASGGTDSYGVRNSSSSPSMTDVSAKASGGTNSYGVYNIGSSPTMTNVTARASGGTNNSGVYNATSSSPSMTNVNASASAGTNNYGVSNITSSPTMTDVTAIAIGGSTYSIGMINDSSSPTIINSLFSGTTGGSNYGIYNGATSSTYTILINNSTLIGATNTIRNDTEFTVRVGASQLSGGAVSGGGTFKCISAYDENYDALSGTCG